MTTGVLLMAYGTPEQSEQVEAYYTHIHGGRTPSPESVRRLQRRYELVGGRTPLLDITLDLRHALERELNADSGDEEHYRVYVGMKHWHPFIGDVLPRIADDGISDLVAIALAPHYSRISIGGYRTAVEAALGRLTAPLSVRFVDHWHLHALFVDLISQRIAESLLQWPANARSQVVTVFSAHSLPERIREWDDPYERQLLESCRAVSERAGLDHWRFAWQSAGETGEKWLGPDICDVLETLYHDGVRDVLSAPIGFVSDHLEILYDIDYVARGKADALGMTLRRTRMPNVDPAFVRLLAAIAMETVVCAS